MKADFSRILRRVAACEEVLIKHAGTPVARLIPVEPHTLRDLGHRHREVHGARRPDQGGRIGRLRAVRTGPRQPIRTRVTGIGVISGPTLHSAVRHRSFDGGVENRPWFRYTVGNYSPPSEPSGPNWRGLSIPARAGSIEPAPNG